MRKNSSLLLPVFVVLFIMVSIGAAATPHCTPSFHTIIDTLPSKDANDVDTTIFTKVEQEAGFPGGINGWIKFLETHLKADIPVKRKAPAGKYTVVVQFIVDKKGAISDIRPLTSLGYGMEKEVERVLKQSPKWIPAQQNGRPVKAYRKQPITFVVSEE